LDTGINETDIVGVYNETFTHYCASTHNTVSLFICQIHSNAPLKILDIRKISGIDEYIYSDAIIRIPKSWQNLLTQAFTEIDKQATKYIQNYNNNRKDYNNNKYQMCKNMVSQFKQNNNNNRQDNVNNNNNNNLGNSNNNNIGNSNNNNNREDHVNNNNNNIGHSNNNNNNNNPKNGIIKSLYKINKRQSQLEKFILDLNDSTKIMHKIIAHVHHQMIQEYQYRLSQLKKQKEKIMDAITKCNVTNIIEMNRIIKETEEINNLYKLKYRKMSIQDEIMNQLLINIGNFNQ